MRETPGIWVKIRLRMPRL